MENKKHPGPIAFGILALGCFFIGVQYFYNRSLWFDEALLALNIINRDFAGLLSPLDYYQSAPVLFLLIERFFVQISGQGEMSLRAFPVLCSLFSVLLFYRIAPKLYPNKTTGLLASSLFCLSPSLIYFSSEVKQYACDVLVLLLNYWVMFRHVEEKKTFRHPTLSIVGIASVFLSNIAPVVLCTTGILLVAKGVRQRSFKNPENIKTYLVVASWMAAFAAYYFLFIAGHPLQQHMTDYWQKAFPPQNPFSIEFLKWCARAAKMVFTRILAFPEKYGLFALFVLGYVAALAHLFNSRKFELLFLLTAPVGLHFALAYFQFYPFDHRFMLYQTPLFAIGVSIGFYYFYREIIEKRLKKRWPVLLFLPSAIFLFQLIAEFPIERDEIKRSINFINKNIESGDNLYVYYGAAGAFRYYRQIGFASVGNPAVFGQSEPRERTIFIEDLAQFKGRIWVLFSHLQPFGTEAEKTFIVNHLSEKGKLLGTFNTKGSAAYLFDLGADE